MIKLRITLTVILCLCSPLLAESIQESSEHSLSSFFGTEAEVELFTFEIPDELKLQVERASSQRFFRNKIHYWEVSVNDSTKAYAILDNVMGKAMPITILVLFDEAGIVLKTEIVKYREAIGGEVSNPRWLTQFSGLTQKKLLDPATRIDGISGATISVRSVSRGIKKLSLIFPDIKKHALSK